MLTDQQLLRYNRHIMLGQLDIEGQQKLLDARVLIIGVGGLGSPVALYLAASGVGQLVLVDDDQVELSNLQRQIIHDSDSIDLDKVESGRRHIARINPDVVVHTYNCRLEGEALAAEVAAADLVVDCTDNFKTRFALNEACYAARTPLVSGAAIGFSGQISVFDPRVENAPCYRCLYQEDDARALSCAEAGVIAPLVGVIGTAQALEAVKLLAGLGEPLTGRLLVFDALAHQWQSLKLPKNPDCPVCGQGH